MSIKDQIRAEIRQRIKKFGKLADAAWRNDDPYSAEINEHIISELQSLIVFTYTLPEQPVENPCPFYSEGYGCEISPMKDCIGCGNNRWGWGTKVAKKQPASDCRETCKGYQDTGRCFVDGPCVAKQFASEELEEAAYNFALYYDNGTCDGIAQDCFIAGAEWMKAKMLEEAVEGEVLYTPYPTICLDDCRDYDIKDRSNVRVIIIKEDEK